MASIVAREVDFSYDAPYNEVFTGLSLTMDTTWRTGLIGRNGLGKSTLLRLLAGELQPSAGSVEVHRATTYFPAPFDRTLTTTEVLKDAIGPFRRWEREMTDLLAIQTEDAVQRYSGIQEQYQSAGGYVVEGNIEREFNGMDLPLGLLGRRFGNLSGGEQTRALIAALFVIDGRFPLIDEPTNHLDIAGREQLSRYLADKPGFLLVSHDRHFLDTAIDHVVSINKSDIQVSRGNYTTWKTHMDEVERHQERARANIERDVKQLKRASDQRRHGALSRERDKHQKGREGKPDTGHIGARAAKQMKKALVLERRVDDQLEEKQSLLRNQEKQRQLTIATEQSSPKTLMMIQNLTVAYGEEVVLDGISFALGAGDRVAIVGPNGSGKSTLFKAITGEVSPLSGVINRPRHVTYSTAYQHPIWHTGSLRALLEGIGLDETRFRQILGSFGVRGDVFERPLETFSQGQLKKVDLCRSMMMPADFLMWDEPMNYVDVFSREQIEEAILEDSPSLLFIDHDRHFVEHVATQVIELSA